MNLAPLLPLVPALIGSGRAVEALDAVHVITTIAVPLLADPALFADRTRLIAALAAAATDGRLAHLNDALYDLAGIAIGLLQDPDHAAAVMALLTGWAGAR